MTFRYDGKSRPSDDKYMLGSPLNLAILSEIGLVEGREEICFEEICDRVPKKLGSRSSILSVLNDGVMFKYLDKRVSKRDRRLRVYEFSKGFSRYWHHWIEQLGNGFKSIIE